MASSEELDSGVYHDQVVWNSVLSPLVILDKFFNIVVATMQVDMDVARLLQASVWVEDVAILSQSTFIEKARLLDELLLVELS